MSSKITNTEKNALLLKRVNNRPNALVTYGTGKLNGTETKDLFDKQFELVVERHNELCDDVEDVEQSFTNHKQSVDESIKEQNKAIEQKHAQQDGVINGLGQQVSGFDARVTDLEDRAAAGEFKGEDGYTPVKGKDYFTPEDISEMVREVINALPNGDEVSY